MKKIKLSKTNNIAEALISHELVVESSSIEDLKLLLSLAKEHGFTTSNRENEMDDIQFSLGWVSNQWEHNGTNEPPKDAKAIDILRSVYQDKKQFRCVEYGKVLTEILQSIGFVTRVIALRSKNVAYGGFGQGHVAMEVWLNSLQKWIFLDPQFGVYLTKKNSQTPLSFYELFLEKKNKRFDSIKVHPTNPLFSKSDHKKYKDFIKSYMGHMSVSSNNESANISLHLEAKDSPITFQSRSMNNVIFTDNPSLLYPQMNKVVILLKYIEDKEKDFFMLLEKHNIKSDEDYIKNMQYFATKPLFEAKLITQTKNLIGFEYRFDNNDQWQFTKVNLIKWDASLKEKNLLEVRSVNQFDRIGPITFVEILYK